MNEGGSRELWDWALAGLIALVAYPIWTALRLIWSFFVELYEFGRRGQEVRAKMFKEHRDSIDSDISALRQYMAEIEKSFKGHIGVIEGRIGDNYHEFLLHVSSTPTKDEMDMKIDKATDDIKGHVELTARAVVAELEAKILNRGRR